MNKCIVLILALSLSVSAVFAGAEKFYSYEGNLEAKFIPHQKVDSFERAAYKSAVKNEKYMRKMKYEKAEELLPDFIPNLGRFVNIYTSKKDFSKALYYAQRLEQTDVGNLYPRYAKDYKLGILYSQNKDYINSNKYLLPYSASNSWALFQIAQNYYYMRDLKSAENYALKVPAQGGAYLSSMELLFTIYESQKNPQKAYKAAKKLIELDTANPQNYLKLASVTSNNAEKLINYYRAKQIYYSQNLLSAAVYINDLIAPLEQDKIDKAYKKLTVYCKKPDWNKIRTKNKDLLKNDYSYWDERQTEFFENTNDCISRYSGSNLAACFNDINSTQLILDKELAAENERREERARQQAQIELLIKQNMLLEEQNRIQWSRYNYYYPRYNYGYWWY